MIYTPLSVGVLVSPRKKGQKNNRQGTQAEETQVIVNCHVGPSFIS